MPATLEISLNNPESGWAYARLSDGGKEFVVTASYSPVDVLRDFVDAVQSLQSAEVAECCWFQESGELHWNLRRNGEELEVEILKFSDTNSPGHHRGDAVPLFKAQTTWLTFARQLLNSFRSIRTSLGPQGYERAWRHPFPEEAYEKLQSAVRKKT